MIQTILMEWCREGVVGWSNHGTHGALAQVERESGKGRGVLSSALMATAIDQNLWPFSFPMRDLGPCEISRSPPPTPTRSCLMKISGVRVFTSGLPECVIDARHYSAEEYPQFDRLAGRVVGYRAMPVYDKPPASSQLPISVLEIVSPYQGGQCGFECLHLIKEVGLKTSDGLTWLYYFLSNSDKRKEIDEIGKVLNVVCRRHQLPVAQIWINENSREELAALGMRSYFLPDFSSFMHACANCFIRKGQGVVGKAFSSQNACFCRDLRQLNILLSTQCTKIWIVWLFCNSFAKLLF
ncbi:hypothetical protein ACH5RR_017705 [Cinchona calisaya]|uniref:NLP1-9 GAF domain-containing protein n=1 Tax=Cinchona calisaya TaxID=153742 RepID=A0ABD2ZJH5_9GENT